MPCSEASRVHTHTVTSFRFCLLVSLHLAWATKSYSKSSTQRRNMIRHLASLRRLLRSHPKQQQLFSLEASLPLWLLSSFSLWPWVIPNSLCSVYTLVRSHIASRKTAWWIWEGLGKLVWIVRKRFHSQLACYFDDCIQNWTLWVHCNSQLVDVRAFYSNLMRMRRCYGGCYFSGIDTEVYSERKYSEEHALECLLVESESCE